MVRPKAFDPDGALATATELFWSQGYHTTSLSQLEKALGIGRKSLYDTFGDKRSLFLRCLEQYVRAPYPIARPAAGWAEIQAMFQECPFFTEGRPGCLLANTALEFGVEEDAEVAAIIQRHLERLEQCFRGALQRAQSNGDIADTINPRTGARYLVTALQGMAVMAKSGSSPADLRASVAMTLSGLNPL